MWQQWVHGVNSFPHLLQRLFMFMDFEKSRAVILLEIFSGFQNTIWICFSSKIVISNSNWVNMSKQEKIIFFSKKSWFSLKILKYVQKYWHNRFPRLILHINIKYHQNRSINREFHFFFKLNKLNFLNTYYFFQFAPIFSLITILCNNRNRNRGYLFQDNHIITATAVFKNTTTEARTATAVFWKLTTDPSLL